MNALMQQQCGPQKLRGRHHCASLYARMSDAFAPVCHLVTKEVRHFASTTTTTIRIKIISSLNKILMHTHIRIFIRKYLITGRKLVNFEYLVSYGMKQMNSSELLGEQYP
ncbi:hypothetical protein T12_11072 [Trichinella patagoniensis]|uniref:Uncharacterized protein n=1 Tax=Trichinella patagoniensis TaxID=990121 RepID=A0A0V0ZWZ3_9BILA|nr:hypothetical protein T12_11072 [Trichinella patagoniensis]